MRHRLPAWLVVFLMVAFLAPVGVLAQGVPPLVRFSGVLAAGPTGTVPVVFSLYREQADHLPLWTETQNVTVDADGRYTVALGLGSPDGLPSIVFADGGARWVGARRAGEAEQPRLMLLSVPYALKAGDAETIGGKPLSAFVLAGNTGAAGSVGLTSANSGGGAAGSGTMGGAAASTATSGTVNYVGLFTDNSNLGNSVIYQNTGMIGVNTTAPSAPFHVASNSTPAAFFDVFTDTLGALPVVFRAARGTSAAPTAVQTDDILGGLAVRGYGATKFSGGRGQVMFKAAENWTDGANGTYLTFATEPLGASTIASERMRITAGGRVGIGTTAPAQLLSVSGIIESTTGGVKFPDGTTQTTAFNSSTNSYSGTQTITSGNLALPATTAPTSGVITLGGQTFAHAFGATTNGNVFVGGGAGSFTTSGNGGNTGVGALALASVTTGYNESAFGFKALNATTSGIGNSAFGAFSLLANTTGIGNHAFGPWALASNTTGKFNNAFGSGAAGSSATVDGLSAFGEASLGSNTSGTGHAAFGYYSLAANTTGSGSTAFGSNALLSNTTGDNNAAFGRDALKANTASNGLSAFGTRSLAVNTTGTMLAAFGYYSLAANTTGANNSAFGFGAMEANTTGSGNVAMGASAMVYQVVGNDNTALGMNALLNATNDSNTGVGYSVFPALTTGTWNTAVGKNAGVGMVSGTYNTVVGALTSTNVDHSGISYATAIGAGATVTSNNAMALGGVNGTAYAVNVGIGTSSPNTKLQVMGDIRVGTASDAGCIQNFGGTQIAGTCSSDLRLKTNVEPFAPVLSRLVHLTPVHFNWRAAEYPDFHFGAARSSGLIAQDVEQAFPEMVTTDARGFKRVDYTELPYLTLEAVRELKAKSDQLESENAVLKAALAAISERLALLERK